MNTFLVDEGVRGVLAALFVAYTEKITPNKIECEKDYKPVQDDLPLYLRAAECDIQRVERALVRYAGLQILSDIKACLCFDGNKRYMTAYNYAHAVLESRRDIKQELSYPDVWEFFERVREVKKEAEYFIQSIKFRQNECGVVYAQYCPDNDITKLIMPSLFKQSPSKKFIVHDIRRNFVGICNGRDFYYEKQDSKGGFNFEKAQKYYQSIQEKYSIKK